ncbi:MAG: PIG-L deacetylase family protein [Burkholderiaceae bacterium]
MAMGAVGAGRRIRGEGTTDEAAWQHWLDALNPTALAIDDVVTATQRLVVVSPHPDDEVLTCGGLIALHAQRGGVVAVVAVTDGEASHRNDPAWSPDRLGQARRAECQRGLAHLGLDPGSVTGLALPDGQVAAYRDALRRRLRPMLRSTDCVVSTWRLDGHPDHDAAGNSTAQACADVGCRLLEAPVWMWHWSAPNDPRVPWQRLRALPLPRATQTRKAAALAEHGTQLTARRHDAPVLGTAILARAARSAEYFLL